MKLAIMATGGIDSTTLLYLARKHSASYDKIMPVYACYGQTVLEKEIQYATFHCRTLNLSEPRLLYYRYTEPITPLTNPSFKPTIEHDQDSASYYTEEKMLYHDTHIEGRNAIMLAHILSWCSLNKVDELWAGYKFTELDWKNRRSYKLATSDNGPDFVDAINILAKYGYSHPIRFRAPFMERRMDKPAVIRLAKKLNIDLNKTHSCYFPIPCGKCDNCILVKEACK